MSSNVLCLFFIFCDLPMDLFPKLAAECASADVDLLFFWVGSTHIASPRSLKSRLKFLPPNFTGDSSCERSETKTLTFPTTDCLYLTVSPVQLPLLSRTRTISCSPTSPLSIKDLMI